MKILDFGISKLQSVHEARTADTFEALDAAPSSAPTNLTATGIAMGSPPYMSPEQLRSTRDVDLRSDIWAIGAILYELVTGARTFPGAIPRVADILNAKFVPMQEARADVPEKLALIVARCLRAAPEERFASVADLAQELSPFAPPHAQANVARAVRWQATSPGAAPPASPVPPTNTTPVAHTETTPDLLPAPMPASGPSAIGIALAPTQAASSTTSKRGTFLTAGALAALIATTVAVAFVRAPTRGNGSAVGLVSPVTLPVPVSVSPTLAEPSAVVGTVIGASPSVLPTASPAAPSAHARPRATPRAKPSSSAEPLDLGRL